MIGVSTKGTVIMMVHYYDFMSEFIPALAKRLHSYVECSVEDYVEEWPLWVPDCHLSVDIDYDDFEDFAYGERDSFVIECEDYEKCCEFFVECASTDVSLAADAVGGAYAVVMGD